MAFTLQQAFEVYKAARAVTADKKKARLDADEAARVAKEEHQAAMTAEDNAQAALNGFIKGQSEPQ